MIIISSKPGQLGNLLLVYAHFMAYSIENKIRLLNPAFYEYRSYFKSTSSASGKLVYTLSYYIARVLVRLRIKNALVSAVAIDWHESIDLEQEPLLKSKLCFVQGWQFRSDTLLIKHKKQVFEFFKPNDALSKQLDGFFEKNFPERSATIIAIHVRRGDYKTFENGRFYYSVEQYLDVIAQLHALFNAQKVYFLVCSNEKPDLNERVKQKFNIVFGPHHELLDMYSMARCNYIAGPPSTYTMWASFYGSVPLYMIHDIHETITPGHFKTYLPGT
jgi:hypothetical protein